MKVLFRIVATILFVIFFGFALKNTQEVALHFFLDYEIRGPHDDEVRIGEPRPLIVGWGFRRLAPSPRLKLKRGPLLRAIALGRLLL